MSGRFYSLLVAITLLVLMLSANDAQGRTFAREVRSAPENATEGAVCEGPCGWAVYSKFTRKVDYFLKNPYCKCPEERPCQKSSDDISVSAFVYTCRPKNQNDPSS